MRKKEKGKKTVERSKGRFREESEEKGKRKKTVERSKSRKGRK